MLAPYPKMDGGLRARFAGQLRRGDVVLFTGAGFSRAAIAASGVPVPSVAQLRSLLWPIAFPNQPVDDASTLGDLYDCAVKAARNRTRQELTAAFTVQPDGVPDVYRTWFSMPWFRMYTLNVDNLEEAAARRFSLPRRIRSISAVREGLPPMTGELIAVHLNGRLDDFPDMTFSQRQYGERTARPDPWYEVLVADLASRPVLFVGTELDEPPLWQHLELRRRRTAGRELRPGSYLVTPSLSAARRTMLEDYNVDWIQMDQETFAKNVLGAMQEDANRGLAAISERLSVGRTAPSIQSLAELLAERPTADGAEFLLGREPEWSDITGGYAVQRQFEADLINEINDQASRIAIITGTGGSGKSTTLMRLALEYHANGRGVAWLNQDSELATWEIRRAVGRRPPDVLAIDNLERFGDAGGGLLADLATENPSMVILTAIRSTRVDRLQVLEQVKNLPVHQLVMPHLEDADIHALLDALDKANRLGQLKGMTPNQRYRVFKDRANRQLLVAMIEATSGQRFEEKIDRECADLGLELGLVYAIAVVATAVGQMVSRDELLVATGRADNDMLNNIQRLINQRLLTVKGAGLSVRHRVIADRALDYYHEQHQLREPLRGLTFAIATKVHSEHERRARERVFLTRLLSHDMLINLLTVPDVRAVYEEVEDQLSWDYHYWLQRGSFEVEAGDLSLAENFLGQADSLRSGDYMVETEMAYLRLKRAAWEAPSPSSRQQAESAFDDLERAILAKGGKDRYPYHVMGSQGLAWLHRDNLTREEKIRILERLRNVVKEGVQNHPRERDLAQLADDLQKEYLLLAVPAGQRTQT